MTTHPGLLPDFHSLETHHCVTGSMRHVFQYGGLDVSEAMLLGLGAGAGFFYRHMKGATPMLLGLGNMHRPGAEGLEVDAARRLGVQAQRFAGGSAKKAEESLRREIEAGRPVMLQLDMGCLPYYEVSEGYHFGGHVVVVAGDADDHFWVADRDADMHLVSQESLAAGRASKHQPFPPGHTWYRFDVSRARPPSDRDLEAAVAANAAAMLYGTISNVGLRGIRKAARLIPRWAKMLDEDELRRCCIDNSVLVGPPGGAGGGMLRTLYAGFLEEAAAVTGSDELMACAVTAAGLGSAWDEVGGVFRSVGEGEADPTALGSLEGRLTVIADEEEVLWNTLREWAAVD